MVIALVLNFFASLLSMVLTIIPVVNVSQIPIVGSFVSTYLTLAVGYVNTANAIFPPMGLLWQVFCYVILPFEFGLLILKVFLGSRVPARD